MHIVCGFELNKKTVKKVNADLLTQRALLELKDCGFVVVSNNDQIEIALMKKISRKFGYFNYAENKYDCVFYNDLHGI